MRFSLFRLIALVALFMISSVPAAHANEEEAPTFKTVIFAIDEWSPYFSKQLPGYGLAARITTAAFKSQGVTVNYTFLPWARSLYSTRKLECDGTLGWAKTPDREKEFLMSDPIMHSQSVFFHRKNNPLHWNKMGDVGNLRVAVTRGYWYEPVLRKAVEERGGQFFSVPTDMSGMKMLAVGRVDVFPCELQVGYYLLETVCERVNAREVTHDTKPIKDNSNHLLISKDHPHGVEIIRLFNAGLKHLKANGEYDRIFHEYKRKLTAPE